MRLSLKLSAALACAGCFPRVGGFVLNETCNKNRPIVIDSFHKAFHMIEIAIHSLEQRPWNAQQAPVYREISQLTNWIFKDSGNNPPGTFGGVGGHPLDRVYQILTSIYEMKNEIPYEIADQREFIVFCDPAPLKRTKGKRIFDGTRQVFAELRGKDPGGDLEPCNLLRCQMWTLPSSAPNRPARIQICPKYFAKMKKSAFLSTGDFKHIDLDSTGTSLWIFPNTAMDLAAVMDVTFLHEFTHTFAGGLLSDQPGIKDVYGWVTALAMPADMAVENPDSIAMFGLAHRMLLETLMKSQMNGTIVGPVL